MSFPFRKSWDMDVFPGGYFFTKGQSCFWLTASSWPHAVNGLFLFRFVDCCLASKKGKTCSKNMLLFCECDKGHVLFEVRKQRLDPWSFLISSNGSCFDWIASPRSPFLSLKKQQKDKKIYEAWKGYIIKVSFHFSSILATFAQTSHFFSTKNPWHDFSSVFLLGPEIFTT